VALDLDDVRSYCVVVYLVTTLLQIFHRCAGDEKENQSIFVNIYGQKFAAFGSPCHQCTRNKWQIASRKSQLWEAVTGHLMFSKRI